MPSQSPSADELFQRDGEGRVIPHTGHQFVLRLLDGFGLEQDGRALGMPQSVRRLVAFLGIRGQSGRAEIAGTLWPDVPEPKAHASLRTVLWRLHRLAATPLVTGREALALAAAVDVDVQKFVAAARRILNGGDYTVSGTISGTVSGTPVPTFADMGELLPGWYDDWALFERERLRQLQMHALEAIAERLTRAHRYAEAIEAALAAIRLEPLRESATRALIVAHLAENNVVEAVRRFESFRAGLTSELGVQPTAELERLVRSGLARRTWTGPIRLPQGALGG